MNLNACSTAPDSWTRLPIIEVCQRITSGGTPSRKCPEFYTNGTIAWVKTKELADGFINQTEETITPQAVASSSAKLLKKDTILLAMYGATVGMLGILAREMACNQACCAMLVKPEFDRDFLFYQLLAHRDQLQGLATGAAQQNLSGQQIKELVLPFPPLDEQRAIGGVLRILDDRITLLRETNATLEAIAQALFKSWFVDFDPVRAKQEGRAPDGMSDATAALFPDAFEQSELGWVPRGWRVASVGNVAGQIFSGGTPDTRKPEYWIGDIPWFSSGETRNRVVIDTEKRINRLAVENSSTKLSLPGDVLIASAGQGHTRGQTSYNALKTYINQSVVAVRANQDVCEPLWLYYNLSRRYDEMRNLSDSHSSRGSLTTKLLAGMGVIVPSREVGRAFANLADQLMEAQVVNEQQAQTLATLRDTLLPRLISGQLRLPEAL